jgi:hypothetical protein
MESAVLCKLMFGAMAGKMVALFSNVQFLTI